MANYKHNILLGLDARQFRSGLENAVQGIQTATRQINVMGTALKAAFAVGTVKMVSDAVLEMNSLGVKVANVRAAFTKLDKPDLLDNLRQATRGMITDMELMQNAVKFSNMNLSVDQLGTLFAFAQKRAQETGESVAYLTNSIVDGLGRRSIKILDNLQIDVSKFSEYVKESGDWAGSLARIINEDMQKDGGLKPLVDQSEVLKTNLSNAWNNLAESLQPTIDGIIRGAIVIFNELADSINYYTNAVRATWNWMKGEGFTTGFDPKNGASGSWAEPAAQIAAPAIAETTEKTKDVFNEAAHAARAWAAAQAELNNMVNFTNVSLNDLGNTMTMIEVDEMEAEFLRVAETLEDLPAKVDAATQSYMWLGEAFNQMFSTALQSGKGFFEQMGAWIENFIKRMLAAAAAAAALNLILPGSTTFMSAFSALSGLRGLTMMAHGGIVDRPTPVIAGEAGPEAIIPLHKLNSMGGTLTTRISGRDLLLILEREQTAKGRLYG